MALTITFTKEKTTPGTVRYSEDGDKTEHKVGTLYVKKAAAESLGNPEKLLVIISDGTTTPAAKPARTVKKVEA